MAVAVCLYVAPDLPCVTGEEENPMALSYAVRCCGEKATIMSFPSQTGRFCGPRLSYTGVSLSEVVAALSLRSPICDMGVVMMQINSQVCRGMQELMRLTTEGPAHG